MNSFLVHMEKMARFGLCVLLYRQGRPPRIGRCQAFDPVNKKDLGVLLVVFQNAFCQLPRTERRIRVYHETP